MGSLRDRPLFSCVNPSRDLPREIQLSERATQRGVGVSLGLFASDPLWDYRSLLEEIRALGATRVMLVVPLKQSDHVSSTPRVDLPMSALRRSIRRARALGLRVSLMPAIQLRRRSMKVWRGQLAPSDLDLWWNNYQAHLKRLADLASEEEVERLVIGAELCSLEEQTARWVELVKLLRLRFKGLITYSANWDHYREIKFWPLLDEVSVTAYFPVRRVDSIEEVWSHQLEQLEDFAAAQGSGRPLLITEYGYPPLASAPQRPWDETANATYRPDLQASLVARSTRLLLKRISSLGSDHERRGALRGAFLWNWFGFGGARDRGFTLRGREGATRFREALTEARHEIK